ncbi:MAG: FtsX-like permease family protein [Deltaproteobacteria bacterium]|nr:FtsX-like permease family protein [Deltaproteobacteria bacterium]
MHRLHRRRVARRTDTPHPHMRMLLIMKLTLSDLMFKRFRSVLTIVGVMIGIGTIYMLLSLGLGLQSLVQKQVTDGKSINTVDISSASSKVIALNAESLERIAAIPHVREVSGTYAASSRLTIDGGDADVVAYGVDAMYLSVTNIGVGAGRMIDPAHRDEIVISKSLLDAVGIHDAAGGIGKQVHIKVEVSSGVTIDKPLTLVGVVDKASGSQAYLSASLFRDAGATTYAQAKALVDERSSIGTVRSGIESLGFTTSSPIDTIEQVDQFFRIFNALMVGFGSLGMLIAILGMVNTLTVSLFERTKEIALMITIGARPKDMRRLFIAEAITLSFVGGIAGIGTATGLGWVVDLVLNQLARSRGASEAFTVFAAPAWMTVATLAFIVVVGFVVALIPARHAARVNPIAALRRE